MVDHHVRSIELFNKNIPIRMYGCKNKEFEPRVIEPARLNLFILLTPKCNARCKFCEYYKNDSNYKFNIDKLGIILDEIIPKINICKLNFSGGEPTLNFNLFNNVMDCVKEKIDFQKKPEITVNTNGYNLLKLLEYEDILDFIALSFHHYDNIKNQEIFGTKNIANLETIKYFQSHVKNKSLVQLRCNLIKGYIDSFNEITKYLDTAIDLGVNDCGFVTLMPLNTYCKNHQIDFINLINTDNDSIIKVNYYNRLDKELKTSLCNCANYIYSNNEGILCKFYSRLFCNSNLSEGQLTYDGEYLRLGFGGEIIF